MKIDYIDAERIKEILDELNIWQDKYNQEMSEYIQRVKETEGYVDLPHPGSGLEIWEQVIYPLPEFNLDATTWYDAFHNVEGQQRNIVLIDGTVITWNPEGYGCGTWALKTTDEWDAHLLSVNEEVVTTEDPSGEDQVEYQDLIGILRNGALIDTVQVASSESPEDYDTALIDAGYEDLVGKWI